MAVALLRRIADGQPHQLERLEEVVAKNQSQVPHDPDVQTNDGLATDARCEISRARVSSAQEDLASCPRRGVVRITTKGLEKIGGHPERSALSDDSAQSKPRRGAVRIATKGLEKIGGHPERSALSDDSAQSKPRAGSAARPVVADESEAAPARSPPLSPDEIADIKAIASGAIGLRRVSKSELYRIVSTDAGAEARAERPAPSLPAGRHDGS